MKKSLYKRVNDKGEWCQEAIRNKRYARHDIHWCKRYLNRSFRRKNKQIKEEF
nr:MAG TPA: hypothetical protein [Caudoviricetes sp.]